MIPYWHSGDHSSSNDRQSKIAIECLISTPSSAFVRQLKNRIHGVWRRIRYQRKAYISRFPMIPYWHSGDHSSSNDRQSKIAIECLISTPSSAFVRQLKNRIHGVWRRIRYQRKAYILRFPMIPYWHSGDHSSSNDRQSKIAIECLISTPSSAFVRQPKTRIHGVWRRMRYQRKAHILRFPMIPHWHSGYLSLLN